MSSVKPQKYTEKLWAVVDRKGIYRADLFDTKKEAIENRQKYIEIKNLDVVRVVVREL